MVTKTKDNLKLDESEEVFKYILCAICPVELAKPALGYLADEGRIGPRIRDWVVGMPDTGFMFPAFNERSTDIHSVLFYTKDTKDPHRELMTDVLGVTVGNTATQKQTVFKNIIRHAITTLPIKEIGAYKTLLFVFRKRILKMLGIANTIII